MTLPHSRSGRMLKDTTIPITPVQQESAEEALRALQDAVGRGVAVETLLWTFNTGDWVTNVQAADIDHDGDIEVLVSTRDGYMRALTRWGSVKWELQMEGHTIKTMSVVDSLITTAEDQASIIVGMRSGRVLALNKSGKLLPEWEYLAGRLVRQIYISPDAPDLVVLACEDRCIHVLDSKTGRPCWEKFQTGDWVRSVFVGDIDGDGRVEILGGSGDTYLYILDDHGNFLARLALGYQCYALFAAPLEQGGPTRILTSSTEKELTVWTVSRNGAQWTFEKAWELSSDAHIFENRIYSIYVQDINKDGRPEILLGSEDCHLYILDQHGDPLWKRDFESSVNSVYAIDINSDDQVEILIGTEDNGANVIHVELSSDLYRQICAAYLRAKTFYKYEDMKKALTFRENLLLKDFTAERARARPERKQMEKALALMKEEAYEEALKLFLQLIQQRVQFYWSSPIETRGYIWAQCFADVASDSILELIVGTDQGWVYAFDIENDGQHLLWEKYLGARVLRLLSTKFPSDRFDTIFALLADHRVVLLNHRGEIVQERTFEGSQQWVSYISIYRSEENAEGGTIKIVLGQENNCISIWDLSLREPLTTIHTAQGISATYIYDINNDGLDEIVSGSLGNHVYAHTIQGQELWRFEITSDVKSLRVRDIDRDGRPEIIVGSEDCYVYVLNNEGKLKWSYRTERSILHVNVCDIKLENDADDDDARTWKILVGGADKNLYVLSAEGDLLWKYKNRYPIHVVRTRDVNQDGRYEIALSSEKQLELLQILNANELTAYAEHCWYQMLDPDDYRGSIIKLTHHQDDFIRAYALAKLAGQHTRHETDFRRFQDALHNEKSSQVKRELVRSIVVLCCRVPHVHAGNIHQARQLLQQLYTDPNEEIKLTIVDILPRLIEIDERLCFEYFERFTDNIDTWVRRTVVRHLDKLVEQYTEATFALLRKTAKDEDGWVRLETGRVLAHYFDAHPNLLERDVLALLYTGTDPDLLRQISFSAATPTIKQLFRVLARLLTWHNEENIEHLLHEAIVTIEEDYSDGHRPGALLSLFEEFRNLFRAKSINDIARYRRFIYDASMPGMQIATITRMNHIFESLQKVVLVVKIYQRREALGDRVTGLLDALNALERLREEIPREELRQRQKAANVFIQLENIILTSILDQWSGIIKRELYKLRGEAHLVASIRNTVLQPDAEIVISLGITNTGNSPAENVSVELEESQDFAIFGSRHQRVQEISSSAPAAVNFSIAPRHANPRLSFRLTFDDAERKGRQEHFADIVTIQEHARPYRFIPNPYTSGTPIRDESMFYGRGEDREILCEKLSSVSANKVVVLSGQRRVGKTSLLNQLAKDLSAGPYAPVFIDLQAISPVTNVAQLLQYFASCISNQVQLDKALALPDHAAFLSDPMATFDAYLEYVLHELAGCRLVFLLDEFERLQDLVNKGVLDYGVLHYLRSVMQHRQNISYLISGAPRYMRTLTETSWSVFFNIALFHHLTRLKDHEAEALITEPVGKYLEYDSLALERVRTLTGDQPYLIHIFSEKLIAHCNKRKKSYLTINDVNSVLDVLLEEQTSSIQWIWSQDSATERFLLAILAQEKGQAGRVFTLSDIEEEYSNCNIPYGEKAVSAALQNLVQDDIVEERFHGTQFRISVGFMKEWVSRTKPPERVAREERLIC